MDFEPGFKVYRSMFPFKRVKLGLMTNLNISFMQLGQFIYCAISEWPIGHRKKISVNY